MIRVRPAGPRSAASSARCSPAIAIILGVAMISGTYVLTDTIDRAFTKLFAESYAGTDAVVHGARARHLDRRRERSGASGRRVGARDGARRGRGGGRDRQRSSTNTTRRSSTSDGEAVELGGRADVRVRHRHRPRVLPVQPAEHPRGALGGGGGRGRHRRGTADNYDYAVGDTVRDLDAPAEAGVRARRRRAVRQRGQPRERELRGVHDPGRAGAARARGPVRRDLGRRRARASPRRISSRQSSRCCRTDAKVVSASAEAQEAAGRGRASSPRSSATSCSPSRRSRSSSARSSSSTPSRSRSRSGRASSRRCGRSARRAARSSPR